MVFFCDPYKKESLTVSNDIRVRFHFFNDSFFFLHICYCISQHLFALKIIHCSTFIVGSLMKMFSRLLVALYESICKIIKCKWLSMYTWKSVRTGIHFLSGKQLSSTISGNGLSFQIAFNIHTLFLITSRMVSVGLILSMWAMLKQFRNMAWNSYTVSL